MESPAEALASFQELFNAGFISQEEFEKRKAELQATLPVSSTSASGPSGAPPALDDITDDMNLFVQVYAGPFKTTTESLRLTFDNSQTTSAEIRNKVGCSENDAVFLATIECEAESKPEELEAMASQLETFFKDGLAAEQQQNPFSNPKVQLARSPEGKQLILLSILLCGEPAAMGSGLIEAVVRTIDLQVNLDRASYAAHLAVKLQGSRNMLELAQEMAGLPAHLAQLAQLYDSSETTIRLKSIGHLANNDWIKQNIPNQYAASQLEASLSGSGLDPILGLVMAGVLKEMGYSNDELGQVVQPFLSTAFHNFKLVHKVQAVFGYSVFDLKFDLPGFFQACQSQLDGFLTTTLGS